MSARAGSCTRKDKRLLVLLAFGAAIALFRLADPAAGRQQAENRWAWLEITGETGRVYRFTLQQGRPDDIAVPVKREAGEGIHRASLHALLDGNRAVALRIGENGAAAATNVSPRLSFLLGLPFPINQANEEELTLLPGIGPALAGRITQYRESRGVIADNRDLRSVRGIGRRLEARLTPYLTFEKD